MDDKYTKQELLILLQYQTTKDFIDYLIYDRSDDLYNKHKIEKRCQLETITLSYLLNKEESKIWNEYIEKSELIVNNKLD